jgi:hypothetical protein
VEINTGGSIVLKLVAVASKSEYDIVSCEIQHKILGFPEVKVVLVDQMLSHDQAWFEVCENESVLFKGRLKWIKNSKELMLVGMPEDYESQQKRHHVLKKLNKSNLMMWTSNLKARDIFDTEKTITLSPDLTYNINWHFNAPTNYVFDLVLHWSRNFYDLLDLGQHIFANGPIKTFTPNSLLNDWPLVHSIHNSFYVISSKLEVDNKSMEEVAPNKLAEQFSFVGELKMQRLCEQIVHENWRIAISDNPRNQTKTRSLFLDVDKYLDQYPQWAEGVFYYKDTKVMLDGQIMRAKQDHMATIYSEDHWEKSEDDTFYPRETILAESQVGKDILDEMLRSISAYLLVEEPELVVKFTGPWNIWKDLEIYHNIQITIDGQVYILRIYEYSKVMSYNKKYVSVVCHGYKHHMKHGEGLLQCSSTDLVEIEDQDYTGIMDVAVVNQAQDQTLPNIQPTRIHYKTWANKIHQKIKLNMKVDWNLV